MGNAGKRVAGKREAPAEVLEAMVAHRLAPSLREVITSAGVQVDVVVKESSTDAYLPLAARMDGVVAVYAHAAYLHLALDPEDARGFRARRGWKIIKENPATAVLEIRADDLADAVAEAVEAVEAVVAALRKSDLGSSWSRRDGAPGGVASSAPAAPVCPVHGTEMLGGECDQCA